MFRETPLHSGWLLEADTLPERLIPERKAGGFSLPGAEALLDFSDLLGGGAQEAPAQQTHEQTDAPRVPFLLPGMLPEDAGGSAALLREIDFARLSGDRAFLSIDQLCGSGRATLDHHVLCCFSGGISPVESLSIDLTDAMRLARRQTLCIRFDDAAGAGVCGAVLLRTVRRAWLEDVRLTPDSKARTLTASVRFSALEAGEYAVRAALVPDSSPNPWRESRTQLDAPGKGRMTLSFSMPSPGFCAGRAQDMPVLKLSLHALHGKGEKNALLCDARTLMTGHRGPAPRAYVPLTAGECRLPPDEVIHRAKALNVSALFLPAIAPPPLFRRCTQEGIALLPYAPPEAPLPAYIADSPCASPLPDAPADALRPLSAGESLWRLCSMSAARTAPWPGARDEELLADAAGTRLDPEQPEVRETLRALRALEIRLRAEAFRQGRCDGPLCAPGQWQDETVANAMRDALAPLHLSALPLRGAWWTHSHFSASLCVFIPEEERTGLYSAEAELIDEHGAVLASFARSCPVCGGAIGMIEGRLPETACRLTLSLRLLRSGALAERQEIPVFVGALGPLQAAFAGCR